MSASTEIGPRRQIGRQHATKTGITVGTVVASSTEIDMQSFSGGSVHVPTGSSITTLTFHSQHTEGGTHVPLVNNEGDAVTLTVAADQVVEMPTSVFAVPFLKLTGNVAGTVSVFLKS